MTERERGSRAEKLGGLKGFRVHRSLSDVARIADGKAELRRTSSHEDGSHDGFVF